MVNRNLLSFLGICKKSGKLSLGFESCIDALKKKKSHLILITRDLSENTKKKFRNMCTYYEVPLYFFGEKETLGHAMGKEFRASLAVLDEGFAKAIGKCLDNR